jgi:hypothetical protein
MKVKLAVALAVLFFASVARADSNLDIALSFTIPPALDSSTVTEQFDASFEYDLTSGQIAPGTLVIDAVGPLASFYPLDVFVNSGFPPGFPQIDFFDTAGDSIQFDYSFDHGTPIGPQLGIGGQMFWFCASAACKENFGGGGNSIYFLSVTEYPPTSTPESAEWTLLALGIVAVLAMTGLRGRVRAIQVGGVRQ